MKVLLWYFIIEKITFLKIILPNTSKFKKIQIDDIKVLNNLIRMENK